MNLLTHEAFFYLELVITILSSIIIIYEAVILIEIIKAKKGMIIDGKYVAVKRKFLAFETLVFKINNKEIEVSPLLFVRGYEYLY